jgi:hypothetical protein
MRGLYLEDLGSVQVLFSHICFVRLAFAKSPQIALHLLARLLSFSVII